jgi:heme ABC exporter ATP-binding subunit CcmA
MAPAVFLREAVALADRFPLLAGVTLDVGEGEIVHLSGPNGAGKSSLLRLCCGLLPLRSGEAVVLGYDLGVDRREVRTQVGYLGHSSFLYEELTIEENLRFALRASGLGTAEGSRRTTSAMSRLGLTGRISSTPVVKLSAGQRRRAAIAVVVGRQPRLWLLDEPHAGLDHEARDLLDQIVTEARAGGATVVLSSHELDSAGALADRVVHLAGGRVIAGPEATVGTQAVTGAAGTRAARTTVGTQHAAEAFAPAVVPPAAASPQQPAAVAPEAPSAAPDPADRDPDTAVVYVA